MTKLLVVVDYQNDFVNGVLGIKGADALDEIICKLIEDRKEKDFKIIYTMDTHCPGGYPDTAEGKIIPLHCAYLTGGWKLYGKTGRLLEDKDLDAFRLLKGTMGFADWYDYLYNGDYNEANGEEELGDIDEVELCGLDLCYCVFQNALALRNLFPRARVIINCFASETSDNAMAAALMDYAKRVGVEVVGFEP